MHKKGKYKMELWEDKKTIFKGNVFSLISGTAITSNNLIVQRDIIEHAGGVAIVPFQENYIYLISQFRISIGTKLLELPAGRLENLNESPIARASLELQEEIGFKTSNLIKIVEYYSSVGFTNEKMHIFLAKDLEPTGRNTEVDEDVEIVKINIKDIRSMITSGKIIDSKTLIGLLMFLQSLDNN